MRMWHVATATTNGKGMEKDLPNKDDEPCQLSAAVDLRGEQKQNEIDWE